MTVEQNLAKMQKEYDSLDDFTKYLLDQKKVTVGGQQMGMQELIDETTNVYSQLSESQKSRLSVTEEGYMVSSGDPEKAMMSSPFAFAVGKTQ